MMRTIFFTILVLNVFTVLQAQQLEVINSGGGYFQNTSGSLTFSIGEVVIETIAHGDLCFTQGFCQAQLSVTTLIQNPELAYGLIVYPNPARDYIILKTDKQKFLGLKFQLFDMNGRMIQMKNIVSTETSIPVNYLAPQTYFLKIFENQVNIKTFKIVKTQ